MSLTEQAQKILNDFQGSSSDEIVQALDAIKDHFKNELTREYLQGKIKSIQSTSEENERKKLCKNLIPYLDWYLQGN